LMTSCLGWHKPVSVRRSVVDGAGCGPSRGGFFGSNRVMRQKLRSDGRVKIKKKTDDSTWGTSLANLEEGTVTSRLQPLLTNTKK